MTRNIFKGMKVPEKENDKITEWTPPEEELDLKEILKPVEYYENRFYQFLNYRTVLLDKLRIRKLEDMIVEYSEEFGQYVDILNGMSGEGKDFHSGLADVVETYKSQISEGIKLDTKFGLSVSGAGIVSTLLCPVPINLGVWISCSILSYFALYQGTCHYGPLVKPLINVHIERFFADLKEYYQQSLERYKNSKN